MRYLFFDIECCNGRDICEFGYVVTDEKFNPIEKKDIAMNPENKFTLTGRPDGRDIHLFYTDEHYYSQPKFSTFYNEIKTLIEAPDQIIVGHAISNDAKFLRTACERFGLPYIDFEFNDSQKMFKEYFNDTKSISLEKAGEILEVEKPKYLHKSDEDSLLTMNFVKAMCEKMEVTLPELIDLCPMCSGSIKDGNIVFTNIENHISKWVALAQTDENNCIAKKNIKLFHFFLDNVKAQKNIDNSLLHGKKICVSLNYELYHFKEMLALIQMIVNCGGKYRLKASQNDIFVTYDLYDADNNLLPCTRRKYVDEAISQGKAIQIISFADLLKSLGIIEKELSEIPFPEENAFIKQRQPRKQNTDYTDSQAFSGISIGELLAFAKSNK